MSNINMYLQTAGKLRSVVYVHLKQKGNRYAKCSGNDQVP